MTAEGESKDLEYLAVFTRHNQLLKDSSWAALATLIKPPPIFGPRGQTVLINISQHGFFSYPFL